MFLYNLSQATSFLVMTRYQGFSRVEGRSLAISVSVVSSIGFGLFGYDQGVMANLVGAENQFGKDFGNPSASMIGLIVAIYELTAFFGSLMVIGAGDWLGRRQTINMGVYIQLAGVAVQCSAYSVGQLIAGRCVTGIGIGILTSGVPVYQAEYVCKYEGFA